VREFAASYTFHMEEDTPWPVFAVLFSNLEVYTSEEETDFAVLYANWFVQGHSSVKRTLQVASYTPFNVTPEQGIATRGQARLRILDHEGDIISHLESGSAEEIRPGTRARIYVGHAHIPFSEYTLYTTMEVVDRQLSEDNLSLDIDLADVLLELDKDIFVNTDRENPLEIGPAHPCDILLQVLLSSDDTNNDSTSLSGASDYNQMGGNGLGIPGSRINIGNIGGTLKALFPADAYRFVIMGKQNGLRWITDELLKTMNAYPIVDPDGKFNIAMYVRLV
jgi:hypothetical protein